MEVIHDAFQGLSYWSDFMPRPSFEGVMIDVHEYQIATPEGNAMSWDQHISAACSKKEQYANFHLWTLVGEWTLAATDCARYGNGRDTGARYEGKYPGSWYIGSCKPWTGDGNAFSTEYKTFLRKFWEAQVAGQHLDSSSRDVKLTRSAAWEAGDGWIYWTWRVEDADEWSYQAGLKFGWIPWDPTERIYPGICG